MSRWTTPWSSRKRWSYDALSVRNGWKPDIFGVSRVSSGHGRRLVCGGSCSSLTRRQSRSRPLRAPQSYCPLLPLPETQTIRDGHRSARSKQSCRQWAFSFPRRSTCQRASTDAIPMGPCSRQAGLYLRSRCDELRRVPGRASGQGWDRRHARAGLRLGKARSLWLI